MVAMAVWIVSFIVCALAAVFIGLPVIGLALAAVGWVAALPFRALGWIGDRMEALGLTF